MLKAVLFDLDDTLIDWSAVDLDWETRDSEMLGRVSSYIGDKVQPISDFKGLVKDYRQRTFSAWEDGRSSLRAPHMGRILVEALVAAGVPENHVDEIEALTAFDWGAIPGITLFPDVPEVLELLLANHIRIGIVTNAHQPMWLRDKELEDFDLLKYFEDCRFSAADVGYLKPHPRIFEAALDCIGSKPEETVFVGDSPVADVAGAQGAGIKAVLRVRKTMSPMLSGLIVPDHTVSSLAELPAILDRWYPGWRS
jgi:putative hydrolase of the HAD superfamily